MKIDYRLLPIKIHFLFFMAGKYLKLYLNFFAKINLLITLYLNLSNGSYSATISGAGKADWHCTGCYGLHHVHPTDYVRIGQTFIWLYS